MSKRGNPDYFKTDGHAAKDPHVDEQAKRQFGKSREVWLRGTARFARPQPPPRDVSEVTAPPVRTSGLPWRVRGATPARPTLRAVGPEPAAVPGWGTRALRLAGRVVLAPMHAALSIAEALVERALWRLEDHPA
jgi:hypothetical protein